MLGKLAVMFSFIMGIFALGYLEVNSGILIFVLLIMIILPVIFKKYIYCLMALVFIAGGALQVCYLNTKHNTAKNITSQNPEVITGVITGEVLRYYNSTYFYINISGGIKARVKLKESLPLYPGNIIELSKFDISVVNPKNKASVDNKKLMGNNAFLYIEAEAAEIKGFNKLYILQFGGKILREKTTALMQKYFYSKEAGIASGMFSGESSVIDSDLYASLIVSGTVHIVVVSGSHFAMLYTILFVALSFFIKKRRLKLFIVLPFLIFYVFYTGATVTVLRSFIMSAIVIFADLFYIRRTNTKLAVVGTAALIIAVTPTLVYNPSFLLSFGAVLGMALFQHKIRRLIPIKPALLKDFLSVFISAQIFTFPVIYYFFARVSKVAVISNLLLEPVVTMIMIVTIIFICASPISYTLASAVAFVLNLLLKYFIFISEWTAGWDKIGDFGMRMGIRTLMFIIAAVISFFYFISLKGKEKTACLVLCCFLVTGAVAFVFIPYSDNYYVTFIGSENSAIISMPDNRKIFYGNLADLYYHKSAITDSRVIALMIITQISDELFLKELYDSFEIQNIVAHKSLEPKLHWADNVKFTDEKNCKAALSGLAIKINGSSDDLGEVILSYENTKLSLSKNGEFLNEADKTVILPALLKEINFNNFDKSIVLLSKKYYNSEYIVKYDNFTFLEISRKGIKELK